MKEQPYLLHALSPLHAGVGHAADVIDLPIARMKSTGIPLVPGSSIKGVLRDARTNGSDSDEAKVAAVFGPKEAAEHAGALMVGDARLLALPVQSFKGVFAWVTSPLLLTLAKRDIADTSRCANVPSIEGRGARVANMQQCDCVHEGKVFLRDLDLQVSSHADSQGWAGLLLPLVARDGADIFSRRFIVVDDDTMSFLWETATQVDARVAIDGSTRTVKDGALWLEESLPPETLLIGFLAADKSRKAGTDLKPEDVLKFALGAEAILQFGGKATTGKGRCRMIPIRETPQENH